MAKLKQETDQIRYSEQIGVNRGGGFAVAAQSSMNQANAWNQLVGDFAQFTLKETQDWGKKLGEKTAKEYEIGTKEVTYHDPKQPNITLTQQIPSKIQIPKSINTASSIEAFEKHIYNKYKNEVQASINDILNDERALAEENKAPPQDYEAIINARLEPLLNNLEPTFKQVIETYSKDAVSANTRMVANSYNRHQEMIKSVEYTSNLERAKNELDKALIYGDSTMINKAEFEIKDVIKTAQANNNYQALGNGKQLLEDISTKKKVFALFNGIHIQDFDNATPLQLTNAIENYKKVASLLAYQGPKEINLTLADGTMKKITMKQVNNIKGNNLKVFEDIGTALYKQANVMNSILGSKVDTAAHFQAFDYNLNNEGKNAILPVGVTRVKWAKDIYSPQNLSVHIAKYNSLLDISEHITTPDARFIKWVLTEQQVLPPSKLQEITTAYTSMNQEAIQHLREESLITFMMDFNHTFSKEVNGMNKDSAVSLDIMSTVGIPKNIQNRMFAIESKLRLDPDDIAGAIESTKSFYDKFADGGAFSTYAQALAFGSGNKITSPSEVNKYISKKIVDLLDQKLFGEPTIPQSLALSVKNEVKEYIMNGAVITDLADLDGPIKSSMQKVLNGETGYGWSNYTYSPFVNFKYDKGDYVKKRHWVNQPLERYELPETKIEKINILGVEQELEGHTVQEMNINWMLPHIQKLVKSSAQYDTLKPFLKNFKTDFGTKIQVMSTGIGMNQFPKYNLVAVNEDGQMNYLTDQGGLPILFDPYPLYLEESKKINIQDTELHTSLDDYRLQRKKNLKNYKPYSMAQMFMDLD